MRKRKPRREPINEKPQRIKLCRLKSKMLRMK